MKHKISITVLLLGLFLVAQLVGLFVIDRGVIPSFFQQKSEANGSFGTLLNMVLSFVIAITLFFFLIQYKWKIFLKIWFGLVILLTLAIVINSFFYMCGLSGENYFFYSVLIAFPFTILKIFRPRIIIHNLTEIFIYSGLALIFVDFLSPLTVLALLVLVSFYDMWAVWHSEVMQKMAKFQMSEMKIFNGFLIPYLTREMKQKLRKSKEKKKIKVPVAILGGGDIAFTLIPAGVFLKSFGWIPAFFVVCGGLFGLAYLLFNSKKKRFYPAMPFITLGIFLAILICLLFGIL